MNIVIECIGIGATLFIIFSMLFKTTTLKGNIRMRILNLIGSAIFVVYGFLLPAQSTALLNIALVFINYYHLVTSLKEYKEEKKKDINSSHKYRSEK